MAQNSSPVVDRIRIIPRPEDFLDRNVGSSGEVFFNRSTKSLRVYSGNADDRGGFEIAKSDLTNVSDAVLSARIESLGISGNDNQASNGASVDVSDISPSSPESGNLWLNTVNGKLYIYINDGDSSQWIQPAVKTFSGNYNDLTNKPVLSTVSATGSYNDLLDRPIFGDSGFDGSYSSLGGTPDLSVYQLSAEAFDGDYNSLSNIPTSFEDLTLTGTTILQQSSELLTNISGATGTVAHNFETGAVFNHVTIVSNFTANFTNLPTTNNRATNIVLILNQGATAYIPNAVEIDGVSRTVNWQGGSVPAGNINNIDLVSFTFTRISNTWTVLGSLTTYG